MAAMGKPFSRAIEIVVTFHARERARERFPDEPKFDIVREIREAMAEGRISKRKPPGIVNADDLHCLYVWTPSGERVYAITLDRDSDENGFAVKTTMRADRAA